MINLPSFSAEEIRRRGDFLATGTLYKIDSIRKMGFYDSTLKNSGLENYEMILKLLKEGMRGFHIPMNLFNYRRHQKNISNLNTKRIIKNGHKLFSKLELGEYNTNEYHPYSLRL